jgi:hypothetical protein
MAVPPPDPSFWTFENVTRLFEIGEAIAVMASAALGLWTLGAWRRENLGKRKLDLAEETLLAFYDLKQRAIDVRKRIDGPAGLKAGDAFEANRSHYYNRLGWLGSTSLDGDPLLNLRPVFQVYFGFEQAAPIDRLYSVIQPLRGALQEIFTSVPAKNNTLMSKEALLTILGWDDHARPDETDRAIADCVAEMEAICKPVLSGRR